MASVSFHVDTKEMAQLEKAITASLTATGKFEVALQATIGELANLLTEYIRKGLQERLAAAGSFGQFMLIRTDVDWIKIDNGFIIQISGKTEGEVNSPSLSRKTPTNPEVNLWEFFEFGGGVSSRRGESKKRNIKKTVGGVGVVKQGTGEIEIKGRKGLIHSLFYQMRGFLHQIAEDYLRGAASEILAKELKLSRQTQNELKRRGMEYHKKALLEAGVSEAKIKFTPTGGKHVRLRGGGGRFISPADVPVQFKK